MLVLCFQDRHLNCDHSTVASGHLSHPFLIVEPEVMIIAVVPAPATVAADDINSFVSCAHAVVAGEAERGHRYQYDMVVVCGSSDTR